MSFIASRPVNQRQHKSNRMQNDGGQAEIQLEYDDLHEGHLESENVGKHTTNIKNKHAIGIAPMCLPVHAHETIKCGQIWIGKRVLTKRRVAHSHAHLLFTHFDERADDECKLTKFVYLSL